jgi:hypothetical protein
MNYQSFAIPSTYMYEAFIFGILIWERSHGEPHSWNILGLQWSEPHAKSYLTSLKNVHSLCSVVYTVVIMCDFGF